MDGFVFADLIIPDSVDSENATDFLQMIEVRNAVALEQQGPDGVATPEELLPRVGATAHGERIWRLAKADGRVVGRAQCLLPADEKASEADMSIEVLSEYRRRGIGTALLRWATDRIREHGQSVAQTQVYMFARDGVATISPSNGFGAIPADEPIAGFALHHGAVLAQVERVSVLDLPASEHLIGPLYDEAQRASRDDYSLVEWTGMSPDEWLDGMALLHTRMTTDAPAGDLTRTEDVWDADRARRADQEWLDSGWQIFAAAAVHTQSGQLVAFTQIITGRDESEAVHQLETLVLAEHRGHRLGALIKIANVRALQAALPSCPRIVTSNAEENVPMLRVNVAMGFRAHSLGANWTLAL